MTPLTHSEFWGLDRDARDERIAHAHDTGTCSVCAQPVVEGQARNGLIQAHWDCSPAPSNADAGAALQKLRSSLATLQRAVRGLK